MYPREKKLLPLVNVSDLPIGDRWISMLRGTICPPTLGVPLFGLVVLFLPEVAEDCLLKLEIPGPLLLDRQLGLGFLSQGRAEVPFRFPARAVRGFHVTGGLRGEFGPLTGEVGLLARIAGEVVKLGRRVGRFLDVVANRFPVAESHGLGSAFAVVFPVQVLVLFLSGLAEERGAMLKPSMSSGAGVAAISHRVGSMSQKAPTRLLVTPALTHPGQQRDRRRAGSSSARSNPGRHS